VNAVQEQDEPVSGEQKLFRSKDVPPPAQRKWGRRERAQTVKFRWPARNRQTYHQEYAYLRPHIMTSADLKTLAKKTAKNPSYSMFKCDAFISLDEISQRSGFEDDSSLSPLEALMEKEEQEAA